MNREDRIFVAGHRGMVGSAIIRLLNDHGFQRIITKSKKDLDLRNQAQVNDFFSAEKPAFVFLAAAKVGGILANNTYRAEFLYDNLMMEANIIHAAYQNQVKKLLFLASSCIYPKLADQPIREEALLTGPLEPTNEPYAIAKIAGVKLCDAYRAQYGCHFISAMPTNLYGPNDNYDLQSSHVLPALLRKFHEAKIAGDPEVVVWGSGTPLREFMHVDDLAEACYFLMQNYDEAGVINVGVGEDIRIIDLAKTIKEIVGYEGTIVHDRSKPDGTPRKLMDSSKLKDLGWVAKIGLEEGLRSTYQDFLAKHVPV